jgi:hypothetical protein
VHAGHKAPAAMIPDATPGATVALRLNESELGSRVLSERGGRCTCYFDKSIDIASRRPSRLDLGPGTLSESAPVALIRISGLSVGIVER